MVSHYAGSGEKTEVEQHDSASVKDGSSIPEKDAAAAAADADGVGVGVVGIATPPNFDHIDEKAILRKVISGRPGAGCTANIV